MKDYICIKGKIIKIDDVKNVSLKNDLSGKRLLAIYTSQCVHTYYVHSDVSEKDADRIYTYFLNRCEMVIE